VTEKGSRRDYLSRKCQICKHCIWNYNPAPVQPRLQPAVPFNIPRSSPLGFPARARRGRAIMRAEESSGCCPPTNDSAAHGGFV
jgi:hypothetical protein